MKSYLEKVRVSDKSVALWTQVFITIGIIISGFALGILQKWIDGSSNDILPALLQQLDIRNYFGRLAIWILLATIISVYSKTPLRASINTFLFFISMLVCKGKRNNSNCHIQCNYWCFIFTGFFNYTRILCNSFTGSYNMGNWRYNLA